MIVRTQQTNCPLCVQFVPRWFGGLGPTMSGTSPKLGVLMRVLGTGSLTFVRVMSFMTGHLVTRRLWPNP